MTIDLEAIRARDAACAVPKAPIEAVQWAQSNADRRALLAAYDALAAAARKVTCRRCWGLGHVWDYEGRFPYAAQISCPDCADLRRILEEAR